VVATHIFFDFHPRTLGKYDAVLTIIFFNWVGEKPPTIVIFHPKKGGTRGKRLTGHPNGGIKEDDRWHFLKTFNEF